MEDMEARHKKERRELEGAARAARKTAGKNKRKEADAAAEQAMTQLLAAQAAEVSQLQDLGDEPVATTDLVGIKALLVAPRSTEEVQVELRVDPADGQAYPLESFLEVYGEEEGNRRWETAVPPGTSVKTTPYIVMGSKKGGFPVSVESRARGKRVTVIHNVSGNVEALLSDLKRSVGAGGVVRDGNVEVQGDHSKTIEAMLLKLDCIKGVSRANIAAALPVAKSKQSTGKTIARLDKKALQQSR